MYGPFVCPAVILVAFLTRRPARPGSPPRPSRARLRHDLHAGQGKFHRWVNYRRIKTLTNPRMLVERVSLWADPGGCGMSTTIPYQHLTVGPERREGAAAAE